MTVVLLLLVAVAQNEHTLHNLQDTLTRLLISKSVTICVASRLVSSRFAGTCTKLVERVYIYKLFAAADANNCSEATKMTPAGTHTQGKPQSIEHSSKKKMNANTGITSGLR